MSFNNYEGNEKGNHFIIKEIKNYNIAIDFNQLHVLVLIMFYSAVFFLCKGTFLKAEPFIVL